MLDYFNEGYVVGEEIKKLAKENKSKILGLLRKKTKNTNNLVNAMIRNGVLKLGVYKEIIKKSDFKPRNFLFKCNKDSKPIPTNFEFDTNSLEFFGLWLADGCYDGKYGVIVSAGESECLKTIHNFSEKFGLTPRMHSDGFSTIISNTTLVQFMKKIGFDGNSYTKKIPQIIPIL